MMITAEEVDAEKLYLDEFIHSNSNEQTSDSCNRKISVQYPNEYESSSQHKQDPAKISTVTKQHLILICHQFFKSVNESSTRLRRESPRQTFPPSRITLEDVNRYSTTELDVVKEINKYCKLNLMGPSYFWSHFNPIMINQSKISSCEKPFYA